MMAKTKKTVDESTKRKVRPALSPEARENQLISHAVDLVEQRLLNGTASSQETVHFLKLGSSKNKLELRKLEAEIKLAESRAEAIKDQKKSEEMFKEAIEAMKRYSGHGDDEYYD